MNQHRTKLEVRQFLETLLVEVTKVDNGQISDTSSIDGDLQMESVAFVELQVALEEHFDIQLNPIELVERNQFGSIVDYLYDLVNARHDGPVST